MHLAERHFISKIHPNYQEIDDLAFRSKNVYNRALYLINQHYNKTGKYLNYNAIDKLMQNEDCYKSLPSKVSQQTLRKLDKNWISYFEAMKSYRINPNNFEEMPKPPQYKNKTEGRNILIYTKQAIKKNNILSKTNIKLQTKKDFQEVRIINKRFGYIIEIVYNQKEEKKRNNKNYACIDLGVNNLGTITSNQHKEYIVVNGRILKSINQFANKKASLTKSKIKKQDIFRKRYFRIKNYLHHASKFIINYCLKNNITNIILGYNPGWKQVVKFKKDDKQNFVYIPFLDFIEMIKYKAELIGLNVIVNEESYTSKASSLDLDFIPTYGEETEKYKFSGRRLTRGFYKSKDGTILNADVNGSLNIGRKVIGNTYLNKLTDRSLVARPVKVNPLRMI